MNWYQTQMKENLLDGHTGTELFVGIRFADNDFHMTFTGFLETLGRLQFKPTKAQIVQMFNEGCIVFYLMFQSKFEYDNGGIREYLQIDERNVYMGDEIMEHVEKNNYNDNGEFHFLASGKVYTV